jgi:hypothetical protein
MLSIQKSPNDKTGLVYVASSSDVPSSSKTVFVKPTVPELSPAVEDKQKEKVNDDIPGTQQPHSTEDLLFAITAVSVGMFSLSAPS